MKKIIFILGSFFILLFLFSCKKDKETVKTLFLSKVYEDGLLKDEYIYSADKKPIRFNEYGTANGQSKLLSFRLYDYTPTGLLDAITIFNAGNIQFYNKYKVQYDVNGRTTRMDDLASDNSLQYYYLLDYNAEGRLVKYLFYNAATSKKTGEGLYTYDTQGHLKSINRYTFSLNNPAHFDSATYIFGAKNFPSHWNYWEMILPIALPNGDKLFYEMLCDSSFYYFVDAPPGKTNFTFSEKQYNQSGYLTRQRTSYKAEWIGPPTINSFEMTYEYVE